MLGLNTSILGQSTQSDPLVQVKMSQIDKANEVYIRYKGAVDEIGINERIIAKQLEQINVLEQVNIKTEGQLASTEKINFNMAAIILSHEKEKKKLKKKLFWTKVGTVAFIVVTIIILV